MCELSNSSSGITQDKLDGLDITLTQAMAALVLAIFTVIGNCLVVLAILKDPFNELRTIPDFLILNLAVCDLIAGIPSELLMVVLHFHRSERIFFAAYTCLCLSMISSALTILTLAFERFIVVAAMKNDFLIYSHPMLAITYIWLISASMVFLPIIPIVKGSLNVMEYRVILINVVGIPTMIFMLVLYLRIFFLVRKCLYKNLDNTRGGEGQPLIVSGGGVEVIDNVRQRERVVAISVFLFVGVFWLCWAPCFVAENLLCYRDIFRESTLADWMRFCGLLNSVLNPVIYALRFVKFRRAVCVVLLSYCYPTENWSLL